MTDGRPRQALPGTDEPPALLRHADDVVELAGALEDVRFHNPENGYTVFLLRPDSDAGSPGDAVTCVGYPSTLQIGARLRLSGRWKNHPRFGRQVQVERLEELLPDTEESLRLYLSSGLIKGVGKAMAGRIVDAFGTDAIRILDHHPERLLSVPGIGRKTLEGIRNAWTEHHGVRALMMFLQPHGISPALVMRIQRAYGEKALDVVRENPYRLAMDIRGVGFLTADALARKLGFATDSPLRLQAGALHVLQDALEDGHVFMPEPLLVEEARTRLGVEAGLIAEAVEDLEADGRIVREDASVFADDPAGLPDDGVAVYLKRFHHYETRTAFFLRRLLRSPRVARIKDVEDALKKAAAALSVELSKEQLDAVRTAATSKVMVLTGGPGTGKTTIIRAILHVFAGAGAKILLAAPTGRAAKRMSEATEREARTIHRLLEYSPADDAFSRNEDNPLVCDLLVVDETSMMDAMLFHHLLRAVPAGAAAVFVGDVHQLPSVGPGDVLADIMASGIVPVAALTEIFRQSAESEIVCNAHAINRGEVPPLESNPGRLSDFYFIRRKDPEAVARCIVDLVRERIPRRFQLDPVSDIQVLSPMKKGDVGVGAMNRLLQDALNPNGMEVRRGERAFRLRDKVMQIRNNYDKDVFNGDMGRISHIDPKERTLSVDFDGRVVPYAFEDLEDLVPAYAVSIHKSQGSEYPAVVIPLMMQHYVLLQRNLVYTAVTRGRKLVVLVGESRALHMAVKNNRSRGRRTRLAARLRQAERRG